MIELISLSFILIGFSGMMVIIFKKISLLAELPLEESLSLKGILLQAKEKIKNSNLFYSISSGLFLQKFLSKIRILALKIENKVGNLLQVLRERQKNKKIQEEIEKEDNYWEKIKKEK
jgi:hypothetical protein